MMPPWIVSERNQESGLTGSIWWAPLSRAAPMVRHVFGLRGALGWLGENTYDRLCRF
jgi:hypothetical protein